MTSPKTVADFIKKKIEMADRESEQHHVQRVRRWVKNWMMYRDNHYGDFDRGGNWVQLPDSQTEDLRYTSDFAFYVEAKATQWTQSNPELSIRSITDSPKYKAAQRHIEKELLAYRQRFWTPGFQQSMAKYAMLSTCYFIHTRPKFGGDSVNTVKFSPKQIEAGGGQWFCEKCGETGTDNRAKTCPGCGANVAIAPKQNLIAPTPSGVNKLPGIELEVELVDPMEIKLDPKCRAGVIRLADWIRRERYIRRYEADALHPGWEKIRDQDSATPERSDILNYKKALEQSVGGLVYDSQSDAENLLRRQYWFDPIVYKSFPPLSADEVFAGVQFKKGEVLFNRFSTGLYVDQLNGQYVKLFNEDKNAVWVGGVDTIDPTSPYGRGFAGLVNLQEMLDEGVSLGFAYMMRDALGLQIYDPMMLEASDVESTRVGGALPLKPGAQMDGRPITSALINVDHKPLSPFTIPFLQMLDSKMPHAAGGAYDVLGGGEGLGAGATTSSGQNQQLQTAAGMIGPALQLRAQAEVEAFYQYLEQRQRFASDEQLLMLAGEWGDADARAFRECSVRKHIEITPVPNSEIPRTQMERRADVAIAIQSGLATKGSPIDDHIRKYGLEQLRIPIEDDPMEQMRRVGEAMLEKMKQAAKYVGSIPDATGQPQEIAQAIAAVVPLVKQRDDEAIPVYKEVFQEFLRSCVEDESSDPNLDLAVQMKMDELEQFDVAIASDRSAKQAMAMAPMAMAQAKLEAEMQPEGDDKGAAAQAQAEAQTQQAQSETELDMQREHYVSQLEAQQKSMDHSENERQRQHETSEAGKQRTHDLAQAKVQSKEKVQLAKVQAKKAQKPAKKKAA